MLLGQELKFKNKLCNLKLGTFFSALLGIGAFIGAFVMMHWEENSQLCVFLCVTAIIGYIFDIIKKYNTWKKEHRKINS